MKETENKIKEVLDKIRPYLINDGGDVEFVKYDKGTVYVKLTGACDGCGYADFTISETIEEILTSEIPEVVRVQRYIEE